MKFDKSILKRFEFELSIGVLRKLDHRFDNEKIYAFDNTNINELTIFATFLKELGFTDKTNEIFNNYDGISIDLNDKTFWLYDDLKNYIDDDEANSVNRIPEYILEVGRNQI